MLSRPSNCAHWREAILRRACETLESEQAAQVERHLAGCCDCRRYALEISAAAAGLRWLRSREVEPSPGFRQRWMRAVEDSARPATLAATAAKLEAWLREWLRRNRQPALGVAGLWALILLFRLSAPDAAPPAPTVMAHSPQQVVRVLEADQPLLAWYSWIRTPAPASEPKPQRGQPRSSVFPAQPAAGLRRQLDSSSSAWLT